MDQASAPATAPATALKVELAPAPVPAPEPALTSRELAFKLSELGFRFHLVDSAVGNIVANNLPTLDKAIAVAKHLLIVAERNYQKQRRTPSRYSQPPHQLEEVDIWATDGTRVLAAITWIGVNSGDQYIEDIKEPDDRCYKDVAALLQEADELAIYDFSKDMAALQAEHDAEKRAADVKWASGVSWLAEISCKRDGLCCETCPCQPTHDDDDL